jgi:SAM-dependent methyltransferase
VLNVGSGGDVEICLRKQADRLQWRFISLDVDPKRLPDRIGSIENVAISDGTFDVIFMMEVLEHVGDTTAAIANINRILTPNGKLIASVPFMLPIHDDPQDFYRFTEFGLRRVFSMFKEVKITPRNGFFESCVVLVIRSLVNPIGAQEIVLLISALCIYVFAPLARLLDKKVALNTSTTGYTIACCR